MRSAAAAPSLGPSVNWTFPVALPHAPGLLVSVTSGNKRSRRPCSKQSQMGTGWAAGGVRGRWESGRPPGMASGPRNPPGSRARRARPPRRRGNSSNPRARPPLTPLIAPREASGQGWPALTAEIRPLFPPETQNAAPAGGPAAAHSSRAARSAGRARGQGGRGSAQAQASRPGQTGAVGGSAARGCPLVEVGRHGVAGAGPERQGEPNPGNSARRCDFPGPRRARGTLSVCLVGMDYWKTRRKVPCKSACTVLFGSQQPVK